MIFIRRLLSTEYLFFLGARGHPSYEKTKNIAGTRLNLGLRMPMVI